MAESPLAKKLGVKPGYKLLIMNAPEGYMGLLGPRPDGAEVQDGLPAGAEGTFDLVQVFSHNRADVERQAAEALRPGGLLWFCYPKGSSGVKTDITRDTGWESVAGAGMEIV